jgi:hypothetical protein
VVHCAVEQAIMNDNDNVDVLVAKMMWFKISDTPNELDCLSLVR